MPAQHKLKLGRLLGRHPRYGPLGSFYIGGIKIRGSIDRPTVPLEDYTFDLNNVDPKAYQELLQENARAIALRWRGYSHRRRAKAEKFGGRALKPRSRLF